MRERVRARYFPKFPGTILFFVPEGLKLDVQGLDSTFDPAEIARACGDVQISEEIPGRWTRPIIRARSAAKAERHQRQKLQEATEAAVLRGSVDPTERDRAALILEKHRVDGKVRELKAAIAEAKSRAFSTGQYMDPTRYRALERELEQTKQKSQALQTQLGQLRAAEKANNMATHATFERAFLEAARELLHEEDFDELKARANEIQAELEAEAEACQVLVQG